MERTKLHLRKKNHLATEMFYYYEFKFGR